MIRRDMMIALAALGVGLAVGQLKSQPETAAFAQTAERSRVAVDDTKPVPTYANFCRITGTPEEVILDYGLNTQLSGAPTQPILVNQRIVMNFYTAKRMLQSLQATIDRYEAAFGVLETDVQKRVKTDISVPAAK